MTIKKDILTNVPFFKEFTNEYIVEESQRLILNTIQVFNVENSLATGMYVDFNIIFADSKIIIRPIQQHYNTVYKLYAQRQAIVTNINIETGDCMSYTQGNGYTSLTIEEERSNR
jgi:hypothetical protein